MLSLIEQIKSGALWDFPGGVHPPENKLQSLKTPVAKASIANELVLPVKQHIGQAGNLIVAEGERVLKGQPLTKYDTSFMLPIHAPTSGIIKAIEPRTTAHPSGLSELCIVLEPDHLDEWIERQPVADYQAKTPEALIEIIRQAGISGMGGAGFPTAKKIQAGLGRTEILIVNAAECEPYITADDVLMQDYADAIIQGIEVVEHILKPKLTIIGIEDNKPQAVKALELAAQDKDIVIRVIPTKYPSGGEKQLIKVLTNKEVPNNGIPADIGLMVQNVGSLYAIQRAVFHGEPLIERIVTLTGNTFKQPKNVWALIGTPVQALLDEFDYSADKKMQRLIMGGPMMGFTLPHTSVPITKTANCILAPTRREIAVDSYEMACIRCGQCAEACPASLLPQQLQWHAKAQEFDKCEELNLKDCIECGACAFVCPSEIPLVKYYRQAKAEIRLRKEEADASERARQRFENKKARMERDKAERENRFKKAADDRRKEMKDSGGDDAIAAAIARVKAQKTQEQPQEASVKPAVAAAIARAKAKQAEAMQQGQTEPDNSEMAKLREERKRQARERKAEKHSVSAESTDKKDAVAAAIARAKAKKEQQQQSDATDTPAADKKAAVAAAIARAKARKAETEVPNDGNNAETEATSEDPKKAAVAAAIARAKARKAKADVPNDSDTAEAETASEDPKKAAVAAAIARAKARKAKAEVPNDSNTAETEATSEDPKKAAVAAAIARAKARKAKAEVQTDSDTAGAETAREDPKKAAVAAAIARAKARKAEQESKADSDTAEAETASEDPKKAAVAAAIARAKARKAEQEAKADSDTAEAQAQAQAQAENDTTDAESAEIDPKKAAVAAAIARAKARKAQQEQQKQSEEKE
ncbi:electron transport complex subunit RsxC [Vibrio ponticus]|uniref:Ion-translocating oxidoreductase complex subunit C n=1 Tax=Vibrio ponticus TaxID=265668 RepID=A0ABX3FD90_9VIBR|nr:electron transport complex subunit RsxC [Vibrio ponticus]OLQ89930.1 electron transport complex subunit RsxC [Vibrio ponticus]